MSLSNVPNPIDNQESNSLSKDLSTKLGDGVLSREEAQELHNKHEYKREEVDALYNQNKNEIIHLTKEHKDILISVIEGNNLKDSSEYFSADLSDLDNELTSDGLNLNVTQYFDGLQELIVNDLPDLNSGIKEKIILSISVRIFKLSEEIKAIKEGVRKKIAEKGGDKNNLASARWEINSKIQDIFKEITTKILPSALLIQGYGNAQDKYAFIEKLVGLVEYKEYTTGGNWEGESQLLGSSPKKTVTVEDQKASERRRIQGQIDTISAMFDAPVDKKNGEFDQWGPNTTLQTHTLHTNIPSHARRFEGIGGDISKLSEITLLNELDQQKEANIMVGQLLFIGPMLLPVVGAAVSAPADLISLLTGEDPILKALKKINPEFDDYYAEDSPLERAFGGLGLALIAVGGQGLAKTGKLAKVGKSLSRIPPHMLTKSFSDMGEKMGISPDMLKRIKDMFLGNGNEVKSSIKSGMKPDEVKAYNDEISAAYKTMDGERVSTGVASDEILEVNGLLSKSERLEKGEDLLGISFDRMLGEKSDITLADILIKAHNVPQGNNVEKGKILMQKGGFTRKQAEILMDQGIAGSFKKGDDIPTKGNDYDPWALSPEEISQALKAGLIDKFRNLEGNAIYAKLTSVIDAGDLTTDAGKATLKADIEEVFRGEFNELGAQGRAIDNGVESSKRVVDAPVASGSKTLSSLRFDRSDLVSRQNELMKILDEADVGLTDLEISSLHTLEELGDALSGNGEAVKAYAKLREIGLFKISSKNIPDTLKQAKLKLRQANMRRVGLNVIPTAYEEALSIYTSVLNGKIEDARKLISQSDGYQDKMGSLFPGKNFSSELNLTEIEALSKTHLRIQGQVRFYNMDRTAPDITKANIDQKNLKELLDEISVMQKGKDSFIEEQMSYTQAIYDRKLFTLGKDIEEAETDVRNLEETVKALESLEGISNYFFDKITEFHMYGGEQTLNSLSSVRFVGEEVLRKTQDTLDSVKGSISDVDAQIAGEQTRLTDQAKTPRSHIATKGQQRQELIGLRDAYKAAWNQISEMLS